MNKKAASIILPTVILTSLLYPIQEERSVQANELNKPTMEERNHKKSQEKPHPNFRWSDPGPSSPVLHPGSVKGAGLMAEPLQEIDSVLETKISEGAMPGAVTLVARKGHIAQHEAYGNSYLYKDDDGTEAEQALNMEKDTIFDVASISKIFTATAAMKLYEEGHFKLDDPVAKHIPEFAQNGKENVTIEQLMTHTSGFVAWVPLYSQGESREDRLQYVYEHPLDNPPGSTYTYSDLNMITLASIIERISGQRLDEFVKENITDPLAMRDTMYNPPQELKDRIAATEYQPVVDRGMVWGEVHDENAWSLGGVAGHAGIFSTAEDLAKLGHMYLNDGRYGGKQILEAETIERLTENRIPEFPGNEHGLGWELSQGWYMDALTDATTLGHTGFTGTSMVLNPENQTMAILLTNRVHPTRDTVSTNPTRQLFARQVADAIPIDMPTEEGAWFSGYGDNLERTMTAKVDTTESTTLSFDTWYRIESDYDYGYIEASEDGETWTEITSPFTGNSQSWEQHEAELPADTEYVRFRYETDDNTNGRGWYVTNLNINSSASLNWTSNDWEKRAY
ncbi:serine hydrolase domain-containing protein [Halobacillus sp. Marseille-P3879]|uniref:serine hydrolase domain-containing protein n=1 Tax=Halobacillus sp. Marseille-P3879 TaxID=2045014 RepID=UPI000C7E0056|nr:serine hydrolase domain-containing protein [Halobacillus sp. Marseille-P3879]